VSIVALVVGMGVSLGLERHWLQGFAQFTAISRKFGDLDVWAHTFNSPDYTNRWVVVRDFANNLAFEGWVNAFSDTANDHELLLRDVVVYESSSSTRLYEVDSVYLSRKKSELTIEFRREERTSLNQGGQDATGTPSRASV
jgi:hypothetical protein